MTTLLLAVALPVVVLLPPGLRLLAAADGRRCRRDYPRATQLAVLARRRGQRVASPSGVEAGRQAWGIAGVAPSGALQPGRRSFLRRSPLRRRTPLLPAGSVLSRSPMSRKPSGRRKRMTKLRRDAYEIADERSGGQCEWPLFDSGEHFGLIRDRCHLRATQHHHRRPRRAGGSTDPTTETAANLLHGCEMHHGLVERFRALAYQRGWLLHDGADPAAVPVLTWEGLVLLGEDGTTRPVGPAAGAEIRRLQAVPGESPTGWTRERLVEAFLRAEFYDYAGDDLDRIVAALGDAR